MKEMKKMISYYVTPESLKQLLVDKFGFVEDFDNKDVSIHVMLFNDDKVVIPSSLSEDKGRLIIEALKKVVEIFPEMEDPAYILFATKSAMERLVEEVNANLGLNERLKEAGFDFAGNSPEVIRATMCAVIDAMIEIGYKLE